MLHLAGGHFAGSAETGRVLYWYLHSALWGRYASSAEVLSAAVLLTRTRGARDSGNGVPLHCHLPERPAGTQIHRIFPKTVLYEVGYRKSQVNAVANFCFLSRETSLVIGKRKPEEYLGAVAAMRPGALASQWIPQDPALWRVGRYADFLAPATTMRTPAARIR